MEIEEKLDGSSISDEFKDEILALSSIFENDIQFDFGSDYIHIKVSQNNMEGIIT